MASLVQLAQDKNAIEFKTALEEKIQEKVDTAISEQKVIVAGKLLGEGGVSGGVKHVHKRPKITGKPTLPKKGGEGGHEVKESFTGAELKALDEKVITPGSVEHMAHAVHACHSGECPSMHTRGTFTQFDHPHYAIHRDNGSINPDAHEMNYHVLGAGGHHKFSVKGTKHGLDVSHAGRVG